ncbi:MAG: hypothetical protein ACOY3X_00710 [Pseudomonadota bacterium]
MSRYTLEFSSPLRVPADRAWEWITSMDGIGKEMSPWMRMSAPRGVRNLTDVRIVPGQRLFRSRITLFGVIPVDYSDLTLLSLDEGSGFIEQSPMGSMKHWRHERRIVASGAGCIVTDTLTFEPRLAGRLTQRIVRAFFTHRHRNLRKHLG